MDFNHTLKSFEPAIASTRKLIDACYTFSNHITLLYSSSISVSIGWDPALGLVPEKPMTNHAIAAPMGYGASKHVVENVSPRRPALGSHLLMPFSTASCEGSKLRFANYVASYRTSVRRTEYGCLEHDRLGSDPSEI